MQSKIRDDDTIAAIATPPGEGAIGIVRLSGPEAILIANRIFRGRSSLLTAPGYTIHHGHIIDASGNALDEVLVSIFVGPQSYTGEHLVEIGCHGGRLPSSRVLKAALQAGARQADPGEFTKRAFLNGKMDLSQAEAVADLISSRSSRAQEVSLAQLSGALSERISGIKRDLLETCSLLEIDLDFSEEGISVIPAIEVQARLEKTITEIRSLISTYETGRIVRDGVRVVIVGPPNAGKSSIFNALLKQGRAIVSAIPGTTRDYIEEAITIEGILFQLVDTAGVRETDDLVEGIGVSRSRELLRTGDVSIAVVDSAAPPPSTFFDSLIPLAPRIVLAMNKIDLPETATGIDRLREIPFRSIVRVSARTGEGIDNLRSELISCLRIADHHSETGLVVTNQRHLDALTRAVDSIELARVSAANGYTNEFVALDARTGIGALAEITGETTSEDILNGIFQRFCVGK